MCGRFAQYSSSKAYAELFAAETSLDLAPRYNLAPTQPIAVVRALDGKRRELVQMRWGLIPSWSKGADTGYSLINARAETVAEKPSFRSAWQYRRCLIPSEGFYEWQSLAGGKQPYFIRLQDRQPFAMAGLWEAWLNPVGERIESCTIIVTNANALVARIHERMPVILPQSDWEAWLDHRRREASSLLSLLRPCEPSRMEVFRVSRRVNDPRQEGADLIASWEPHSPFVSE